MTTQTPEEAQAMIEAAMNGTLVDGGTPDGDQPQQPGDDDQSQSSGAQQPETANTEQAEPEGGAPILSKSGSYTIPFAKLEEAREKAKTFEAENAQLKAQIEVLNAQQQANIANAQNAAQARADAGQQQTSADANLQVAQDAIAQGVNTSVFGDFSEDALAKGIQTLLAQGRAEILAELRAEQEKAIAPIQQKQQADVVASHYDAIYAKHPDANELVQSEQFAKWQESLPAFVRSGVDGVLKTGTTEQVIEVFDTFKSQSKPAAAKAPAPSVQRYVPRSLSEIAGTQHTDVVQQTLAMAETNPLGLMERMESMTPEQRERVMNSI